MDELERELLYGFVTHKSREYLLAHPEYRGGFFSTLKYRWLLKKRARGVPLAYLTKQKEFFGLNFYVDQRVLVPRPDTETLVTEALQVIDRFSAPQVTLVDIGTGSGIIPIAILKNISGSKVETYATDKSRPALKVARANARTHNVFIKFLAGDLFEPVVGHLKINRKAPLIITANLPYGWKAWKNNTSSETVGLKYEPSLALFAQDKGLAQIKKLLRQIYDFNHPNVSILLEFDPRQTQLLSEFIEANFKGAVFEIKKDLAGLNRVVKITSLGR